MSTLLRSAMLTIQESDCAADPLVGDRGVIFNAWPEDGPPLCCLAAQGLLVHAGDDVWILSHLMVDDCVRRSGVATDLVRFYEQRLGALGACWVSEEGMAFARRYIERFGPRPLWQIGAAPHIERMAKELERKARR